MHLELQKKMTSRHYVEHMTTYWHNTSHLRNQNVDILLQQKQITDLFDSLKIFGKGL